MKSAMKLDENWHRCIISFSAGISFNFSLRISIFSIAQPIDKTAQIISICFSQRSNVYA